MLKVSIETSYTNNYTGKDEFGAKLCMQKVFHEHGIELVRVSINKLNKNNEFLEYSILTESGENRTIKKKYKPDIIRSRRGMGSYHKYSILENTYKVVPSKKVAILSNDKYENYLFSKKYQPKTYLLSSFLGKNSINLLNDPIIIKPIRANGGKGIELTSTEVLRANREKFLGLEELYIVQEFKDFSQGYPGIVEGNHDIRLMFAGKNIIETTLRIPQKGNFKSNLGSGGTQSILKKGDLPKELLDLSKKVYKTLGLKGEEIMSMDFAYCNKENKRYLIEINASPGTWYYQTDTTELKNICKGLAYFFKALNTKNKKKKLIKNREE